MSAGLPGEPPGYFLTWTCYGTWLHGDERGSVDRRHNSFDSPGLGTRPAWVEADRAKLKFRPRTLDRPARAAVDDAVRAACGRRGWLLLAINVRSNHVHAVVAGPPPVDRMLSTLKAFATRRLADEGFVERRERIWTRHGSTRYLWKEEEIERACDYVLYGQD